MNLLLQISVNNLRICRRIAIPQRLFRMELYVVAGPVLPF